jgi:hypothetical protein
MSLMVPIAILLFLAPGYLLARLLGSRSLWPATLIISFLVLFSGAFLAGVCRLPVRFGTVAAYLAVVTGLAAVAAWRWAPPASPAGPAEKELLPPWLGRLSLGAAVVIGALLLLRCTLLPLSGIDVQWRWDFLARRVLELGQFDFYPPLTAQDFAIYSYPEAIPPLVSFSYWWLYAAAGRHLAELTALLIGAQYAAVAWLTYRTGTVLFSKRAGLLAVVALATSLLFYRAVIMSQETGLTSLSLIGLTFFIVSAAADADYRAMVLAGLAAALGALAREYGGAFPACGLFLLWWRRRSWKEAAVFALTVLVVAGPWYLRTFLLTGNPLYSNRLLGLPVNPVHAAIMDFYHERLSIWALSLADWKALGEYLLARAPLQLLLGPVAVVLFARRHGDLGLAAGVVVVLFLTSLSYTSGGANYAARVLAPGLVLLSVLIGALLARMRRLAIQPALILILGVLFVRAAVFAAIYPSWVYPEPNSLPVREWPQAVLKREPNAPTSAGWGEEVLPELLPRTLPAGTRLLAENTYAYAALAGTDNEVVPVWSPEVQFLFDRQLDPGEISRRLWDRHIRAVIYHPDTLNAQFLRRESPLFANAPQGWKVLLAREGTKEVIYELPHD